MKHHHKHQKEPSAVFWTLAVGLVLVVLCAVRIACHVRNVATQEDAKNMLVIRAEDGKTDRFTEDDSRMMKDLQEAIALVKGYQALSNEYKADLDASNAQCAMLERLLNERARGEIKRSETPRTSSPKPPTPERFNFGHGKDEWSAFNWDRGMK